MQPIKYMTTWLLKNTNAEHFLFTFRDLRALFPKLSDLAFKTLLSRAGKSGLLIRVCRGLYLYEPAYINDGLLLYHAAAVLRAHEFNYISLETVLSNLGIISQIPTNWISIMSSGRSNIIPCKYGTIEFVHTQQKPHTLLTDLTYDNKTGFWQANKKLALRDMKATHRNMELINWETVNELI